MGSKVSKRSVFTPKTLENILQNRLRKMANIQMFIHYGVFLRGKQKGKNHDLTVAKYKVQQENLSLKTDTLTLHSRKENFSYDVSVLDVELEKRLDFINVLDKLKVILYKLLSTI